MFLSKIVGFVALLRKEAVCLRASEKRDFYFLNNPSVS